MTIGVLLIATHRYKQFVQSLLNDLNKYFLKEHRLKVYLFTDELHHEYESGRIILIKELIPSYRFPQATLLRYHVLTSRKYQDCKYLFYMDVDMAITEEVGEEILSGLTAVLHPGFYKGGGSWETRRISAAFVPEINRTKYVAGGFQGGEMPMYYSAMVVMKQIIDDDKENGIVPVWHDESAWNHYVLGLVGVNFLSPEYCMVEQKALRAQWGIDHLNPKIIALAKNHKSVRE